MGFNSGRHYWEVTLDIYGTEEDIFVGICKQDIKLNAHGCETPNSTWGWQCTSGRKMSPMSDGRAHAQSYGDYSKIGEKIGVLLEFNSNGTCNLSFYRNGLNLGRAFDNIPANTYYPCVSMLNNEETEV